MSFKICRPETIARLECQMFRDFCASVSLLLAQFARYERSGTLSHPALSDLLGEASNRGPLWRLKDICHILYSSSTYLDAQLLDRTVGSIFHETTKLMEATYQSQHYTNVCKIYAAEIKATNPQAQVFTNNTNCHFARHDWQLLAAATSDLLAVLADSAGDVKRCILRLQALLATCRPLLCLCFSGKSDNAMLNKYLQSRVRLIQEVMADDYAHFCESLGESSKHKQVA